MSDKTIQPTNEPEPPDRNRRRGGPRTPEGKQRSKFNSLKSGIFAKIVLKGEPFRENQEDFDELLVSLRKSLRPNGPFEEILLENLALQFFRLARVYRTDAIVAPLLFGKVRASLESNGTEAQVADILGEKSIDASKLPPWEAFVRYEGSIWRQIDRILDRLQQWREYNKHNASRG